MDREAEPSELRPFDRQDRGCPAYRKLRLALD
jgi:hypothetical protein